MATTRQTRTIAPKPVVSAERTSAFQAKTGYTPTTVPSPAATSTTTPESTTTGPSDALKAMSIANSPTTPKNDRGGMDKNNNPITGINRPINTTAVTAPKTAVEIQKDLLKASQSEINGINQYAAEQINALKPRQEERLAETSSVNTLTGLAGSTEANRTTEGTSKINQRENDLVRAEASAKIGGILSGIKTKALEMAQTEREQFRLNTKDAAEASALAREEAGTNAATLAASGVTYEGLKTTDPEAYQALVQGVGGEEMLKAMFTLNRPQETIKERIIENGKLIQIYNNPLTGQDRIETVDLGIPMGYSKSFDAGNQIVVMPDDPALQGDMANWIRIPKGLTPTQAASATSTTGGGSVSAGTYSNDLDAIVGATEAIIPSKFGQETFRKNISKARSEADKISLIASVVLGKADAATKTDFTNQAVGIKQIDKAIKMLDEGAKTGVLQAGAQYAFNLAGKDFDPKLAQINQYLTSAIQPYRNSVTGAAWGAQEDGEYQQLFGSTKYAPEELKQRLEGVKEILASKSATALGSYVNPLGLYGDPFNTGSISTGGNDIASRVDAAGFDYEAMKADGLSDSEILSALGQ